jgi:hypothetical protein
VAAWVPEMFYKIYLAKNHKITKNSTTEAREKVRTDLEFSEFRKKMFVVCLTKFY